MSEQPRVRYFDRDGDLIHDTGWRTRWPPPEQDPHELLRKIMTWRPNPFLQPLQQWPRALGGPPRTSVEKYRELLRLHLQKQAAEGDGLAEAMLGWLPDSLKPVRDAMNDFLAHHQPSSTLDVVYGDKLDNALEAWKQEESRGTRTVD